MIEFFIALAGIAFFGGLSLNEKFNEKIYDLEMKMHRERREEIEAKYVASPELKKEIKTLFINNKHYDIVKEQLADDLRYAIGDDWRSLVDKTYCVREAYLGNRGDLVDWLYHLLLARHGKIDYRLPNFGLPASKNKPINDHRGYYPGGKSIKLAQCLEKQLIDAGVVDVRLVFQPDSPGSPVGSFQIESLAFKETERLWMDYTGEPFY